MGPFAVLTGPLLEIQNGHQTPVGLSLVQLHCQNLDGDVPSFSRASKYLASAIHPKLFAVLFHTQVLRRINVSDRESNLGPTEEFLQGHKGRCWVLVGAPLPRYTFIRPDQPD